MEFVAPVLFPECERKVRARGFAHHRATFERRFLPPSDQLCCPRLRRSTGPLSFASRPPGRRAARRADALRGMSWCEESWVRRVAERFQSRKKGYIAHVP